MKIEQSAAYWFLNIGSFPLRKTIFSRIKTLIPGSYIEYDVKHKNCLEEQYYIRNYSKKNYYKGIDGALEEYEALLCQSLKWRLQADVPIGFSISGGIDSITLAYLAKYKIGVDPLCFMIDFKSDTEMGIDYQNAKKLVDKLGLNFNYINYEYKNNILKDLEETLNIFDIPPQQIAASYSLRLYEKMSEHCKVVVSGIGSDEIFCGYIGDEKYALQDKYLQFMKPVNQFLNISRNPYLRYETVTAFKESITTSFVTKADRKLQDNLKTYIDDLSDYYHKCNIASRSLLYTEHSLTMHNTCSIFQLPDVCGMKKQVEVRSPYLDQDLIEFAISLPQKYKANGIRSNKNKYICRKFFEKNIDKKIAWQNKEGMGGNLNWHLEFAHNSKWYSQLIECIGNLNKIGLDAEIFKNRASNFRNALLSGKSSSLDDDATFNAFLLGHWLKTREFGI